MVSYEERQKPGKWWLVPWHVLFGCDWLSARVIHWPAPAGEVYKCPCGNFTVECHGR